MVLLRRCINGTTSLLVLSLFFCFGAWAAKTPTLILVDKKTGSLKVAEYDPTGYKILKEYHATMGKVVGDKIDEGDLKTPEGIYSFTARLTPPTLKKKFGVMAFYMGYPNAYDKLAGNTGYDIMLHATDEPERLKKKFDSEGCIVVRDEELKEIQNYIELRLTPILVFSELTPEYLNPTGDQELIDFFQKWVSDWEGKNLDGYIGAYHSAFNSGGKDIKEWRTYKGWLNKRYKEIHIKPEKVQYYRHPKYARISFIQNYRSTLPNGRVAHQSRGTKTILVAKEDGQLKIIDEDYTPATW